MRALHVAFMCIAAVAIAACDEGDTTIIQGGGTQLVGNFPGTEITEYLVGNDGRAFNHGGTKVNKAAQVFWNASNGAAIVMYLDSYEKLWAHYWNGTTFTPGVELRGPGQGDLDEDDESDTDDDWERVQNFRVLFLNTTTGGRNGDAIILWVREDDPAPDGTKSSNDRLYGTYFDVSQAGSGVSGSDPTVHWGFETQGTVIDFDNQNDDVTSFGFVSDSLRYTHPFDVRDDDNFEWPNRYSDGSDNGMTPATRSGDPTSFVWIVWRKAQNDVTSVGARFHAVEFDLAQTGNAIPAQGSLGAGTIPPVTGATIGDGNSVDSPFVVHNDCMIWRSVTTTGTGVFLTRFDLAAAPGFATIELTQSVLDGIAGSGSWLGSIPDTVLAGNVYGDDHGLTALYAFFRTTSPSPTLIAAAKTDLDVTFAQGAREIASVSPAGAGDVSAFDGDMAPFAPDTRISRDNQWIFLTWLQASSGPVTQLAGISGVRVVHMHGVQTRTTATARTLANSAITGGPFAAPNQLNETNNPALRIFLQAELANGMEDPRCGIQSDAARINIAWHEGIPPAVELKHNGLEISLSTSATTPPTGAVALGSAGLVAVGNTGFDWFDTSNGMLPVITDLGTAGGEPLIYFFNNQNNATDPAAPGAFSEGRIFGFAGLATATPADAQLISTNGPAADQAVNDILEETDDYREAGGQFLQVKTTPSSQAAGSHGGVRVHLVWLEPRAGERSMPALKTRSFLKSAFDSGDASVTFGTAHVPALSTTPVALGGPEHDEEFVSPSMHVDRDEQGPIYPMFTANGNTVGLYFSTLNHWWYQEFNGAGWLQANGEGAPEPVDNNPSTTLFWGRDQRAMVFPPQRIGTCDNLNGTILFSLSIMAGGDPGTGRRLFARVHE